MHCARSHCHVNVEDTNHPRKKSSSGEMLGRAHSKPVQSVFKYQTATLPSPPAPVTEEHDAYVPSATMSVWNVQMGDVFLSIALGTVLGTQMLAIYLYTMSLRSARSKLLMISASRINKLSSCHSATFCVQTRRQWTCGATTRSSTLRFECITTYSYFPLNCPS